MAKDKVYVTGSTGFLGTHLVKSLEDKNKEVITIPHEELSSFAYEPFTDFYFLSTFGNLASHTSDKKILQANVIDLIRVMEKVFRYDFNSFVFMSTSSVKLRMQTMYSRTKKAAEEILLSYMEKYRIPICIIRPFSITGVGEQPAHLIPSLIRSCLDDKFMSFVGSPAHDFIDVSDVVNGMLSLSENSARGVFELGTGEQHTNQEVLELVEKVTGKKANLNNVERLRNYDTNRWVSTNFRARGYGWLPKVSLESSISGMVDDYDQTRKKNS